MYRLFTLEEATHMIPTVDRLLGEMQEAASDLAGVRERLARVRAVSVEARNGAQETAFLLGQLQTAKAELDRLGVHLKDVESGVVDFPSQLGAEVICLSWEKGQSEITHYHRLGEDASKLLPGDTRGSDAAGV
jgi:hypothetical protein